MANLPLVKVAQGLTAAILNGIIGRVNGQALTGIVPTSVLGGTVSANGQITFTNASSVSVRGAFTTDYDNYRFVWNSTTRSAAQSTQFRLSAAGADITTATYAWLRGQDQGTSRSITSGTASTAMPLDSPIAVAQTSDGYVDIFGPALPGGTSLLGLAVVYDATNGATQVQVSARNTTNGAVDGFTIFPTTGTFTGTLRIYGYNNLV